MRAQSIITGPTQGARLLFWIVTAAGLAVIYAPALYLLLASLNPGRQLGLVAPNAFSFVWYAALVDDRQLMAAFEESALIGFVTALVATPLGLSAALAYREMRWLREAFLLVVLLAMFIPGAIQGLGLSTLLRAVAVKPSWLSVAAGHLVWVLPFAFTVSLVGLSTVKPVMIAAARDLGASAWRAFIDVTFPLVRGSLISSSCFRSCFLSMNSPAPTIWSVGRTRCRSISSAR